MCSDHGTQHSERCMYLIASSRTQGLTDMKRTLLIALPVLIISTLIGTGWSLRCNYEMWDGIYGQQHSNPFLHSCK